MRTSSFAALIAAALAVALSGGTEHACKGRVAGTIQASFLQVDPPTEREQTYRWDTIQLRHADAATISVSLGGVIGPTQVMPKDLDRSMDLSEDQLFHRPMSNLVPDSIQALVAVPGANELLARGTIEDIAKLRELVTYFDNPQPRYRLTLWSDTQRMSATVLEREIAHLVDRTPTRRLEVDMSARATEAGEIVVRVSGIAGAGQRQCTFSTTTSVTPGAKTRALEYDAPNGRTSLYLSAEVDATE